MTTMTRATGIKCGNHNQPTYHANVIEVKACFAAERYGNALVGWKEEGSQVDQDHWDQAIQKQEREETERVAAYKMQRDTLYPGTTPTTADRQFVRPEERDKPVEKDGIYRNPANGEIFKVQWNRGSGDSRRLYAKKLILATFNASGTNARILHSIPLSGEKPGIVEHSFSYAPGAMKFIRPEWRMTMDEAKQFGALYGTCLRCGRTLTLEESIERAMGSTCAKKANWA